MLLEALFRKTAKLRSGVLAVVVAALASGCGTIPRVLNFPFDASGRSLNGPFSDEQPAVTENYIVFASDRGGRQDIYLYDIRQRKMVDLPGLNALDLVASHPDLSANGRYITFTGSRQGRSDIYLYDRQTRQLRKLTGNLTAEVRHPDISADGRTVAFESNGNGQWDILVYDRAGRPINVPMMPR